MNTKYYQLIPLLFAIVTIAITIIAYFAVSVSPYNFSIPTSTTMRSITSDEFRDTLFTACGVLIPLGIDHLLTVPALFSTDIFMRMESFLLPFLIVIIQSFNVYFITQTTPNNSYFWNYYMGINIQIVALSNSVLAIQAHLAQKSFDMVVAITLSSLFMNVGVLMAVFSSVQYQYENWGRLWILFFALSILCNLYVAYRWMKKYRLSQKTGLKNQPDIYAFYKIVVLTLFLIAYIIINAPKSRHAIGGDDTYTIVGTTILVIIFFFFIFQISHQRTRDYAKFSIVSLFVVFVFIRIIVNHWAFSC